MIHELSHDFAGGHSPGFSDASAVRAWLENADESAAVWLYEKYVPLVRHVCSRSFLRPHLVEDATQDSVSRAFQSLAHFDASRCLAAWFASIARHVSLDYWRYASRRREVSIQDSPEAPGIVDETSVDLFRRANRIGHARDLVATLEPEVRELVEMRYVLGFSNGEIADRTGLASGNVAIRLMRARRTLVAAAKRNPQGEHC